MTEKLMFFVDDEPMFINLLEYTFKCRQGYTTQSFLTAEACVEQLNQNPGLVVVDYFLDSDNAAMSGIELIVKLKEWNPHLPVIVLSGNSDSATIASAMKAGATSYIVKDGYFIDKLIEQVSLLLPEGV